MTLEGSEHSAPRAGIPTDRDVERAAELAREIPEQSDSLIVLNNDTLVCVGCYELNAPSETTPDVDYGLWPMGRVTEGQCSNCGDTRS